MNRDTHRISRLATIGLALAAAFSPATAGVARATLFAATDTGLLFESTDDGPTWTLKGEIAEPEVVALSPGIPTGTLFALGRTGSLYRSTTAGAAWSAVGNAGASDCVSLVMERNGALLALTRSGDVSRSFDGGARWFWVSSVGAPDCAALAVGGNAGFDDTLFVATSSGEIARAPGPNGWTTVGNTGFTPVVDLLWVAGTLHAFTDAGEFLRSTDAGASWAAIGAISQVGMRDLAFAGGKFKAISREGEVYESADGVAWSDNGIGTTNQVFTVAFAPGVPEFQTGIGEPTRPALEFQARPSIFSDRTSFFLSEAHGDRETEIEIFDTAGRRVTRLHARTGGPPATWDGRLSDGTRAASGVYFARVARGSSLATARLVLVR